MPRNLKCFFQDCDELAWAGLVLISWVPGAEILHVPCAAPMIAQTQNSNVLVLIWETYFTFFQDSGNVFVQGFFQQVNVFCFAMCKSHKFNKQGKKCASWIFYCPVQEPRIDVSPCCESASEPCGIEIQHGTYMHCDCDKTIPENKNKIGHVEVSQFSQIGHELSSAWIRSRCLTLRAWFRILQIRSSPTYMEPFVNNIF